MTRVPPLNSDIQIEALRARSAGSEGTMQAIGGAINKLRDDRDSEATTRAAADNSLQGQINSTNTALTNQTARINQATRVYRRQTFTFVENPQPVTVGTGQNAVATALGGVEAIAQYQITGDNVNWTLERITGGPYAGGGSGAALAYRRTLKFDTGIPVSANTWVVLFVQSTFANLFWQIHVWQSDPV
jgi:hypothetical protein